MATAFQLGPAHIPGFRKAFQLNTDGRPNHYASIARQLDSVDVLVWEYLTASGVGAAAEMANPSAGIPLTQMTAENRKVILQFFGLGLKVNHFEKLTDQTGFLGSMRERLNEAVYHAMETTIASVINNATNSSYPVGYDNLSLANASHTYDGGTFSNITTAASLSYAQLSTMTTAVRRNHKDKAGKVWFEDGWDLLVPTDLDELSWRLLMTTTGLPETNEFGNTQRLQRQINWVPGNPFFTSTTMYALNPRGKRKPIVWAQGPKEFYDVQPETGTSNTLVLCQSSLLKTATHAQGFQYCAGA